jgi:hypothetical protein
MQNCLHKTENYVQYLVLLNCRAVQCTNSCLLSGAVLPHTGNPTVHDDPGQSISAALSSVVKRPEREADYPPPSSAEVNNDWM